MNCNRCFKAGLLTACLLAIAPAVLSAQDRPTSETADEQAPMATGKSSKSTAKHATRKKLPPREDKKFFNGVDLTGWDGSGKHWRVEDGAIVGNNKENLKKNLFIWSSVPVEDFHLVVDVKIEPWNRNAGIQFRSRKIGDGQFGAHGYQADAGGGFWGRLFHEHGRNHLDNENYGYAASKRDDWNRYEILAVDDCIWATVNGTLSISVKDPKGERSGHIAFQVHAGEEQTARYKIIKLIHNPKVQLAGYTEEQLRAALREPKN